jgi:molybdopterin biosynthesis enzyme
MAAARETRQTIARLTPLAELTALMDREVKPVAPRALELTAAAGAILARDVAAPAHPKAAIALIDGWALSAEATRDAGGYAPVLLANVPPRVEVGDAVPPGTDCVAPLDIVKVADGRAEVLAAIDPGDGVLPAGGDNSSSQPLRRAGERLRQIDLAACAAAGVPRVTVQQPRLHVAALRRTDIIGAAARAIAADIERSGGIVRHDNGTNDFATLLNPADADALITLGGTGAGRRDTAVSELHEKGRVAVHGVALTPGETMSFGFIGDRPVLLLPGRLDAALAVWLTAGRHMLRRLAGAGLEAREPTERLPLARKVTSTVGLTELIPVRRLGNDVEPLASKYLPFSALTRSDGWILVPSASEGYSAGALVSVSPWP